MGYCKILSAALAFTVLLGNIVYFSAILVGFRIEMYFHDPLTSHANATATRDNLPSTDVKLEADTAVRYDAFCENGKHANYFAKHLRSFYNLANQQSDGADFFLEHYVGTWPKHGVTMFDIGAACYKRGSDSVLAIKYVKLFGCANNRFIAFEPQSSRIAQTVACINDELFSRGSCIKLENAAMSNISGFMNLFGKTNTASLETHLRHSSKKYSPSTKVAVWTVANYSQVNNIDAIDLLKIDTEGHDFTVVQGALPMLETRKIMAVMIEVSDKMNPDFWRASYGDKTPAFHGKGSGIREPNVRSVWQYMTSLGYYGFWLGHQHMIPLSSKCWDDRMEICGNPWKLLGRGICWFDIIFILNHGYGSNLIQQILNDNAPIGR